MLLQVVVKKIKKLYINRGVYLIFFKLNNLIQISFFINKNFYDFKE